MATTITTTARRIARALNRARAGRRILFDAEGYELAFTVDHTTPKSRRHYPTGRYVFESTDEHVTAAQVQEGLDEDARRAADTAAADALEAEMGEDFYGTF